MSSPISGSGDRDFEIHSSPPESVVGSPKEDEISARVGGLAKERWSIDDNSRFDPQSRKYMIIANMKKAAGLISNSPKPIEEPIILQGHSSVKEINKKIDFIEDQIIKLKKMMKGIEDKSESILNPSFLKKTIFTDESRLNRFKSRIDRAKKEFSALREISFTSEDHYIAGQLPVDYLKNRMKKCSKEKLEFIKKFEMKLREVMSEHPSLNPKIEENNRELENWMKSLEKLLESKLEKGFEPDKTFDFTNSFSKIAQFVQKNHSDRFPGESSSFDERKPWSKLEAFASKMKKIGFTEASAGHFLNDMSNLQIFSTANASKAFEQIIAIIDGLSKSR